MTIRCVIVDDEELPRERIRSLLAERPEITVLQECDDGMSAVQVIETLQPDLVFLDVQMPRMNGFEVLDALQVDRMPAVVFITAYDQHATRAFDVDAIDYVLKPIVAERFFQAVSRAAARLATRSLAERSDEEGARLRAFVEQLERSRGFRRRFLVRRGNTMSFVQTSDVDWLDAAANYVALHVAGKMHLFRGTLAACEAELDPDMFVRVHRGVVVNVERIVSLTPTSHGEYELVLRDGSRITSGRTYSERLRALFR